MRRSSRARDPKVERLSHVQLFSACSKRDLSRIAVLAEEIEVPAGKVLMRQGDPGREAFVIAAGRAGVAIRGRRRARLGPGDCFGEMALLHRAPRSATVTAESDMRLLVIGTRQFSELIDSVPIVGRRVLEALAERLREAERPRPHH